jgi:ClpP class serine protease
MDTLLLDLANQHFYATPESVRAFFSAAIRGDQAHAPTAEGGISIAEYGAEYTLIRINGLMLRERSWYTDNGYAVSTEQVIEEINGALDQDKKVRLLINSGGGLVSGTSNLAQLVYENRDRVEAYTTGVAASAAMWVYSSAGKRYAEDTSVLGSIGVVTSVIDDEKFWESHGIVWKDVVSANAKNKRPDVKTESGLAEVQRYLTSLESVFLESVSRNLGIPRDEVISKFHEGGLITGADANELGFLTGLTSHTGAAMPTAPTADVKIAQSNNTGEGTMPISQEEFDAVQSQLDDATASIKTLTGDVGAITQRAEAAETERDALQATVDAIPEIVAMAFAQGADSKTTVAMVKAGNKADAALVLVESGKSSGGTQTGADVNEPKPDGNDANEESEEEAELALKLAEQYSAK